MNDPDAVLLERFVRGQSQAAFAEIVRRHVDLVYSVARRTVRANDLAEDVTQAVFIELARAAGGKAIPAALGPWLYGVTRRKAVDVVRRETRRRAREQVAVDLSAMNPPPSPWSQIEIHLDEALESLPERDRGAVMLHYFEKKTFREVGEILGGSEDAAQKRVTRALGQLRGHFHRRGLAVSAATLGSSLLAHGVECAPAGLAPAVVAAISSGTAAVAATAGTLSMITLQKTLVAAAAAAAIGLGFYARQNFSEKDARIRDLEQVVREARGRESQWRRERGELLARAQAAPPAPETASTRPMDPMIAAAGELVVKVRALKDWLAQHPERAIPELALLGDEDWLQATKEFSVDSEQDMRKALSAARLAAKRKVMDQLGPALRAFAAANDPRTLENLGQVIPYLPSPVAPAILARYAIEESHLLIRTPNSPDVVDVREPAIGERADAAVDDDYDTRFVITVGGNVLVKQEGNSVAVLNDAISKFSAAHGGEAPTTADELTPFLSAPVDPARIAEYLKGGGHGG